MHRAMPWVTLTICTVVFAAAAPVSAVAMFQTDEAEADETATAETRVEPVAGISYANAAPLSIPGSGTRNSFTFSVGLAETFDDNVFGSQESRQGDLYTEVRPAFLFGRVSQRTRFQFSYRPGFRIYRRFSGLNRSTHTLDTDYNYRASKRWTLSFGNRFSYLPGTDSLFASDASSRSVDPLFGTRTVAATLREDLFSTTNYFQAQFQWSPRSYVAVGTTYHMRRHGGDSFVNVRAASGRTSYNYRYRPNVTIAAIYQYDRIWFDGGFGQTEAHALLLGNSFRVGRRMDFSVSVGPSYTIHDGQQDVTLSPLLASLFGTPTLQLQTVQRQYGLDATGRFAYNFVNASVAVSYARGINGGGDLYGSARSESIGVSLTRRLSRRGSLSVGAGYITNSFERGVHLPFAGTDRFSAQVQYNRGLKDTASFFIRYRYTQQQVANSVLDGDRHAVTLGFTFSPIRGS